jgi:hypothetical protein
MRLLGIAETTNKILDVINSPSLEATGVCIDCWFVQNIAIQIKIASSEPAGILGKPPSDARVVHGKPHGV